jgi:rod shape determining protein RodA
MASNVIYQGDVGRLRAQPRSRTLVWLRRIDWILLAATAGIVILGLNVLAAGTRSDVPGNPSYWLTRQEIFFVLGAGAMVAATLVRPTVYRRFQWPLALGTLGLIGVVLAVGPLTRGSHRWITVGPFQLQPSELGKLVLVLGLAAFLADRRDMIGEWRTTVLALVYAGIAALLVFQEPDLGTALVYGATALGIMWIAGTKVIHFAVVFAALASAVVLIFGVLPAAGVNIVKPYQTARLTAFLHPDQKITKAGYNQFQSRVAVGSGGIAGRGPAQATQANDNFLPEHRTDFIFAVLGEQRGFIGAALLLGLYLIILWRAIRAVTLASTFYESTVAGGIAVTFLFSVFVNVGMTIGIAPVTGIPLPLMSYGGSSIIVAMASIGVLQAIQLRGRLPREATFSGGSDRRRSTAP